MTNQGHAAMLQLIAEGMRSPAADQLSREQRERVASLLDRIAVDLLVPTLGDDDEPRHRYSRDSLVDAVLPN